MRITKVDAVQVHYVPTRAYPPRSLDSFEDLVDIYNDTRVVVDYEHEDDEGSSKLDPGATAQNNYKPVKYYRCRRCDERVSEYELDEHVCEK
jgi:hypothetical protein